MSVKRGIEVVDYDPKWIVFYEHEADDLRQIFRGVLINTHHVGSTSVPAMRAKPTLDILIEVEAGTDSPAFDPSMEKFGYICRGECLDATFPGTPGPLSSLRSLSSWRS